MPLAARADPDLGARIGEPHHREHAQRALGRERAVGLDGVALDRQQEVDRDRGNFERAQLERDRDHVLVLLTHADDQPAARLESRRARGAQRLQPVGVGVRRADLGVVALARVEVVVEPIDARLFQSPRLGFVEQPDGDADVHRNFGLDRLDDVDEEIDLPIGRSPATRDHAIPVRAARVRALRFVDELRLRLPRIRAQRRIRDRGLRAVAAVLGTARVLRVVQDVHLDAVSEEPFANDPRLVQERKQRKLRTEDAKQLGSGERGTVERASGEFHLGAQDTASGSLFVAGARLRRVRARTARALRSSPDRPLPRAPRAHAPRARPCRASPRPSTS